MIKPIFEHFVKQISKVKSDECRDTILRYGFAFFCTAVATYVRVVLLAFIGDRIPFGTFFLSVITVAWFVGPQPAVFALLLSVLAAGHFVVQPEGSLWISDPCDQLALLVFSIVGGISIALFYRLDSERALAQQHAEKNEALNRQLIESDQRKDEFLSLLSHELRCPLAPMAYAVDLLAKVAHDPQQVKETTGVFSRNLTHLVRLVDDLLDLSRYTRDDLVLQHATINYLDCIDSALEMVRPAADAKQHEVFVHLPSAPLWIEADPVRCCQVVCNLLTNAIKYTPHQGRIQISVSFTADEITTVVEDNGIGLTESIYEKVFQPFFQMHSKRSRFSAGMGLGLAISQKLAELHGGRIDVVSEGAGRGSKFGFILPATLRRMIKVAPPQILLSHQATKQVEAKQAGAKRVMIIDDDHDTADSLSFLLSLEGFQVKTAYDGIKALYQCHEFRPHFIILDIGLPGIDGYEIARRYRANAYGQQTTIIAVSGWGNVQDRDLGKSAGFDAHLVKPITVSDLVPLMKPRESSLVETEQITAQ